MRKLNEVLVDISHSFEESFEFGKGKKDKTSDINKYKKEIEEIKKNHKIRTKLCIGGTVIVFLVAFTLIINNMITGNQLFIAYGGSFAVFTTLITLMVGYSKDIVKIDILISSLACIETISIKEIVDIMKNLK